MNESSERITLALRPRPAQEGGPKPAPDPGKSPPGLDPAVWAEVKQASQTYDYLSRFGDPVEFWEAVRLARSRRGVSLAPDGSPDASAGDNGLAEELQAIRRQLSPMVRDLRRYLAKATDLPKVGEPLEVALGFLLASSRGHQAVAKWLAESDKHLSKAASKLRSLFDIAAPYLEALRPWSLDGPRPPLGAPPAAAESAAATVDSQAATPIAPEALENFRRACITRKIFAETDLQAAFWEILMLNTAERIPCETRLNQIAKAKGGRQLAAFHEEARSLHSRLLPLRATHGRWIEATAAWLKPLPGIPKEESHFDVALAFVVLEPGAKDRARSWLTDPEHSVIEAVAFFLKQGRHAKACLAALK